MNLKTLHIPSPSSLESFEYKCVIYLIILIILFIICSCCYFLMLQYSLIIKKLFSPMQSKFSMDPINTNDYDITQKSIIIYPIGKDNTIKNLIFPLKPDDILQEFNKKSVITQNEIIYPFKPIDIMKEFNKNLTIMSSNKRANVIIDKKLIVENGNNGLNFVVFARTDHEFVLKYIQSFDIGCCRTEMINMVNFIDKIGITDVVIIVSKGNPFVIFSNKYDKTAQLAIKSLKILGAKTEIFRESDNYLLISSKIRDIYYENISPESIYFPYIDIVKKECRMNPGNVKYPEKYIIYNDKTYGIDKIMKCAMEANIREYNKFGILNNYCIPMSDAEYDSFKTMDTSTNCIIEEGGDNYITGYEMDKIYSSDQLFMNKKNGVIFYELLNHEGNKFILNEGIYESAEFNRQQINSIYIPYGYFLFIIKGTDKISFYGPLKVNLTNVHKKHFDSFDIIVIQKHFDDNVTICGKYNNKQLCLTYGKGTNMIYSKLFFKVLYVNLGKTANKLSLYGDIHSTDLIEKFARTPNTLIHKVKFPRIVRSIIVE